MNEKAKQFIKKRTSVFIALLVVFCFFLLISAFADGFNFWSPWSADFNSRTLKVEQASGVTSVISTEINENFKAVRFSFSIIIILIVGVIGSLMIWELFTNILKNKPKLSLSLTLLNAGIIIFGMIGTFVVVYFYKWNATVNGIWTLSFTLSVVLLWIIYIACMSKTRIKFSLQLSYSLGAIACFIASIGTIYFSVIRGWTTIFLLMSLAASVDTFSFLFGKRFGKNPLIKISPSKTWEGAFFGIISTIVVVALLCVLYSIPFFVAKPTFNQTNGIALNTPQNYDSHNLITNIFLIAFISGGSSFYIYWWVSTLALIFTGSVFAIGGDLFFSYIKRLISIKDFSKVLGKHGGVLDRFDSSSFLISFFFVYHLIAGTISNQRLLMEPNTYFSAITSIQS
ncbi:phosphatidate cytidylyltransferase [Mycoplasmoides genitalium]